MTINVAQQWLSIICKPMQELNSAVLMTLDGDNKHYVPLAKWPTDLQNLNDFIPVFQFAQKTNNQACIENIQGSQPSPSDYLALPIAIPGQAFCVIILNIKHTTLTRHNELFQLMQQALPWLSLTSANQQPDDGFYTTIVKFLAACIEQPDYQRLLIQLVTELTQLFQCEQVFFGEMQRFHCKVAAVSNSADFDDRANLMRLVAEAMDEAIEQDNAIIFPGITATTIQRSHQQLARKYGLGSVMTVPLLVESKFVGAVTLIRSEHQPFEHESLLFCQQALALITPYLLIKKASAQPLDARIVTHLKTKFSDVFGFKYLKLKLVTTAVACLVLLSGFVKSEFRVTADAVLEGKIQRVIAAPMAGFLTTATVRAGDIVHQGDLLASLDDTELQLEQNKHNGQLQKLRREYRDALSSGDLVKIRVLSAQLDQEKAECDLIQQQLLKTNLTAPFDGVIIEGDLSQMLGSPIERGNTLFKIAPLKDYRIILKINERLISYISTGQSGTLVLPSIPDHPFPLTIQKITAVAKAENGENIFRVEASMDNTQDLLRPGMEGIAKVSTGQKRLLWIWSHGLIDWLRLTFWTWRI